MRAARTRTSRDERGLGGVRQRHDDRSGAAARERVDERERARHRAHGAVEAELAEHGDAIEHAGGELVGRGQEPERDRELESGARLAHTARARG